jgi:hypothetical protein
MVKTDKWKLNLAEIFLNKNEICHSQEKTQNKETKF